MPVPPARKFSRHIANILPLSNESDEAEKSDDNNENEKPLADGEEVYLLYDKIKVFSAKYEKTSPEATTVHGITLQKDEGRFFITKVMRNVSKWKEFDVDRMQEGAPVKWKISDIMRKNSAVNIDTGTEARFATPRSTRKRKRQPEKWKRNKKQSSKEFWTSIHTKTYQKWTVLHFHNQTEGNESSV